MAFGWAVAIFLPDFTSCLLWVVVNRRARLLSVRSFSSEISNTDRPERNQFKELRWNGQHSLFPPKSMSVLIAARGKPSRRPHPHSDTPNTIPAESAAISSAATA